VTASPASLRPFSSLKAFGKEDFSAKAKALNQKGLDKHEERVKSQADNKVGEAEER
jgi:hypothetical protein